MKKITLEQTNSIISHVKLPCGDPERLMNALNIFIRQYEQIQDTPNHQWRTKIKDFENDIQKLRAQRERESNTLLEAGVLITYYKKRLLKKSFLDNDINSAWLVLAALQEDLIKESDDTIKQIKNSISLSDKGPMTSFKNLFFMRDSPKDL